MAVIEKKDCLVAMLFGYHFEKARLTVTNSFSDIADAFLDANDKNLKISIKKNELQIKIRNILITFTYNFLIINTILAISKPLFKLLPDSDNESDGDNKFENKLIPFIFLDDKIREAELRDFEKKDFRKDTLKNFSSTLKLIERLLPQGLPAARFIGLVEYYYIPLNEVKWTILEKFRKQATFPGNIQAKNSEKIAQNRYYFPKDKENNEICFIFKLIDPDNHKDEKAFIAGAMFDYQLIPSKASTLEEMGGTDFVIDKLALEISNIINISDFIKLE